jgi:hypothetical protein
LVVSSCSAFQAGVLVGDLDGARGLALFQRGQRRLQQPLLLHRLLVAAAHLADEVLQPLLDRFHVGEHQLGLDRLGIGHRVDRPSTWVTSPSSKQRSTWAMASTSRILARNWLPSPSPFDAPFTSPGDVDEGHPGRDDLLRPGDLGQLVEPRVRHRHLAHVGLDGAERESSPPARRRSW